MVPRTLAAPGVRTRLGSSRSVISCECHYPNLISRFMKLMPSRLSQDWQQRKDRDQFIGWSAEQCRRRRALVANSSRLDVKGRGTPGGHGQPLSLVDESIPEMLAHQADMM